MHGSRFDTITQRLSAAATRRRLVGGLLGGAAILTGAALAQTDDVDAKKGGKGKGKGRGKNKGKAKGKTKVFICHKGEVLRVASPALKGHLKHGDTECGEPDVCQTGSPTSCDAEGVCTFASVADNTACTTEEIVEGHCEGGVCVEGPPL
jgi:hypothetical protein